MTNSERGFLLLSSRLGDPNRNPLTYAQMRMLGQRYSLLTTVNQDSALTENHLYSLGIDKNLSSKILALLDDEIQLDRYLTHAKKLNCIPITRASEAYPSIVRKRIGQDSPGCIWARGDLKLLQMPTVSLVGCRDLSPQNREFARAVGYQAAKQGYVLVSGNARGADIAAQNACLDAGGFVISVVPDVLAQYPQKQNQLYLCENDFDEPFSSQRALQRNRIIHALGEITFVAQSKLEKGGTWSGCIHNLKRQWSPLFCFDDGSAAAAELARLGASLVSVEDLSSLSSLLSSQISLF